MGNVNGAMTIVSGTIVVIGMVVTFSTSLPIEVRHMGGGFLAAGFIMLITNAVIAIVIKGKKDE